MVTEGVELTEDEAQLYDRQIRLWGLDSQKRLRCARVLVIGINGFGAEVCKNVILAGVQEVMLMDDKNLTEEDSAQFLAPTNAIGENRAKASLERAQALNPLVDVTCSDASILHKSDDFYLDWDVIVAIDCDLNDYIRLNNICRKGDVKFFCGDVFGFFGFFFEDLNAHAYSKEVVETKVETSIKDGVKRVKYNTVKQTKGFIDDKYVTLDKAISADWSKDEFKQKLQKMDFSFFLMKILWEFRSENSRNPQLRSDDIPLLKSMRHSELSRMKVLEEKVPDSILNMVLGQMSPVCAIVGGVLAQEVIKCVSHKDTPHNNFFFFNPETNVGHILRLS